MMAQLRTIIDPSSIASSFRETLPERCPLFCRSTWKQQRLKAVFFQSLPTLYILGAVGDIVIFCCDPIWYRSDSSWCCPRDNHLYVYGADVAHRQWQREWAVQATEWSVRVIDDTHMHLLACNVIFHWHWLRTQPYLSQAQETGLSSKAEKPEID